MNYKTLNNRLLSIVTAFGLASAFNVSNADILHLDDVIISFSLCVGNDCVNGESFGFDTVRLKENNLRMHFQDTSTSASFPTNDWRFIFNDSSNGGGNYFAVEDSNAARQIFRVDAGAPANSLRVDSQGDVGIGTSNPVVDIHDVTGNTPTLRLEQNGSSGFTPQTWDIAGNEANFFIRDATNGSKLPFRIQPSAPTDSLYVKSNGNIGLGTNSPAQKLHIENTAGDNDDDFVVTSDGYVSIGSDSAASFGLPVFLSITAPTTGHALLSLDTVDTTGTTQVVFASGGSSTWIQSGRNNFPDGTSTADRLAFYNALNQEVFTLHQSGNIFIGVGSPNNNASNPIDTATGAYLSSGGVWTNSSSRVLKNNIAEMNINAAKVALDALKPVTYNYKSEPDETYSGFIAEDVPELVAMNDRKSLAPMDIVAVLTKVVQNQQNTIDKLSQRLESLESNTQSK